MKLSAPTQIVFLISVVVAVIGLLAALRILSFVPVASVWIMLVAYIILTVGCVLKGV